MSWLNDIWRSIEKKSPEILIGVAIASGITSTILAVRATPKALLLIEERKKELNTDKLEPTEVIRTTWKLYIPAAATGVLGIASAITSGSVYHKRNMALASLATASEQALLEYKDKVIEDKVKDEPPVDENILIGRDPIQLCKDYFTGRYFMSSRNAIDKAVNEVNARMLRNLYVSMNDFYYEIGIRGTGSGDLLGWNMEDGYFDPEYTSVLTPDGRTCLCVNFKVKPKGGYDRIV